MNEIAVRSEDAVRGASNSVSTPCGARFATTALICGRGRVGKTVVESSVVPRRKWNPSGARCIWRVCVRHPTEAVR
jgi:hypothetical protein